MTARAQRHARRPRGPFTRIIDVKSVPAHGSDMAIEATSEECAAVAADLQLPGVASLAARFDVARRAGERIHVKGNLRAHITQRCVVTLDNFESRLDQPIDLMFAPVADPVSEARDANRRGRAIPILDMVLPAVPGSEDQVDAPDPIIDDMIDIGAVVVEFLALACDPYPRKPGVAFDEVAFGDGGEPEVSPFAALERLKDRT